MFVSTAGLTALLAGGVSAASAATFPNQGTGGGSISAQVTVQTATSITLGNDYEWASGTVPSNQTGFGCTMGVSNLAYPYTLTTPPATGDYLYENGSSITHYLNGVAQTGVSNTEPLSCVNGAVSGSAHSISLVVAPNNITNPTYGIITGSVTSNDDSGWQVQVTADAANAPGNAAACTTAPAATTAVDLTNSSGAFNDLPWDPNTYGSLLNSGLVAKYDGTANSADHSVGGAGMYSVTNMACPSGSAITTTGVIPWTDIQLRGMTYDPVTAAQTPLSGSFLSSVNATDVGGGAPFGTATPAVVAAQSAANNDDAVTAGTWFSDIVSLNVPSTQIPTSGYYGEFNYTVWGA